jgi:hypothetical protein
MRDAAPQGEPTSGYFDHSGSLRPPSGGPRMRTRGEGGPR